MTSVARKLSYAPEEYLAIERKSEYKSELVHGEMYAMSGASREHNTIALNVGARLLADLRGKPCRVFVNDMRVKISDTGAYLYPDVVVACGDIQFEDTELDTLLNPILVIEVLPPTTEAFDRGAKFDHYRRIPSLQEYVLIAQDRLPVQRYLRQDEGWLWTGAAEMGEEMPLSSIGCELPLSAVYEKVEFPAAEAEEEPE